MKTSNFFDIFIPSYHRPNNCKTAEFYVKKVGWPANKVHVFIDTEADDRAEYEETCNRLGCKLHVFDISEARRRYDFVHRRSVSQRAAGMARNMFFDFARENNISFYMVQDDDTMEYCIRWKGRKIEMAQPQRIIDTFVRIREFMERHQVGLFGLSQTGDLIGSTQDMKLFRKKVMNTTFYLLPYVYRGERGVQDNDTSLYCGVMNEGLFTGSFRYGLILRQKPSATQKGGLTDLYKENKLLNKALVCPIQYPSAIYANRQKKNGGRLHHRINYRYLMPCLIKNEGGRSNIAWDTYPEDIPFTNEPKRKYELN